MSSKYSLLSNTTAGDRLLYCSQDSIHLSTGDNVFLDVDPSQSDPNKVSLVLATGATRTTQTPIATLSAVTAGNSGTFLINRALPQCLALCRDASDNLYIFGASASIGGATLMVCQAFIKGTGLVWTPGAASFCTTPLTPTIPPVGYVALWCNTGTGSRYPAVTGQPAGYIIVACTTNVGTTANGCFILDAGKILAGTAQAGAVYVNPAFIGDSPGLYGSNLDLSADGFGAMSGLAISASGTTIAQVSSWGVGSTGTLTTGGGVAAFPLTTGTLSTTTKLRISRIAPATWAAVVPSPFAGHLDAWYIPVPIASYSVATTATTSNFPTPSATLSWDMVSVQGQIWIYGWSTQAAHLDDMLRVPVTFPAGVATLGAVVIDDTNVGGTGAVADNTTIRTVKLPIDWFHADWQSYDVTSPFSLNGDYSVLPVQPDIPTLVLPLNNASVPLATGGTLDWNFTSPEAGDAQTAYALARTGGVGARWWDGVGSGGPLSDGWLTTETYVTSAVTSVTFAAGHWAAGTYGWSVSVGGAGSAVPSAYSTVWHLTVVAQPSTPAMSAIYDSANNRVTLTVGSGTGTNYAWFQYSDDLVNWYNVRGGTVAMVSGAATVWDYEAPPGATRTYRVAQYAAASPGNVSAWSVTQSATPAITTFWLRDPLQTNAGIKVHVLAGTLSTSFGENLAEHNPLGSPYTLVIGDTMGAEDGGCTFFTYASAEADALAALIETQRTLLFHSPDNRAWFIRINVPRPVNTPYIVQPGSYRERAVTWRGQPRPPA